MLIIFLVESNGSSSLYVYVSWRESLSIPHLIALTMRHHSVGSPITVLSCKSAWLQSSQIVRSCLRLGVDWANDPSVLYPEPLTVMTWWSTATCVTVISFLVRVPVLSEQIVVTDHSVSTEGSFLIRAFFLTIRLTPSPRDIVTTAGNPSGIAATARATDARNAVTMSRWLTK